jgi:hypothetical protein
MIHDQFVKPLVSRDIRNGKRKPAAITPEDRGFRPLPQPFDVFQQHRVARCIALARHETFSGHL